MLATRYGVVNFVLTALGLIGTPVHWLSDPAMSMTALNIAHVWFGMPFSMILIAAALAGIPGKSYEAAELDGACHPRRFRHITLPAIAPALFAVACLVTIASLRAFDVIFALNLGWTAQFDQLAAAAVVSDIVPGFPIQPWRGYWVVCVCYRIWRGSHLCRDIAN